MLEQVERRLDRDTHVAGRQVIAVGRPRMRAERGDDVVDARERIDDQAHQLFVRHARRATFLEDLDGIQGGVEGVLHLVRETGRERTG